MTNGPPIAAGSLDTCPACAGAEVRVAHVGPAYPIYWCDGCGSYFCTPPARGMVATIEPPPPDNAASAHGLLTCPEFRGWARSFGDVRVELQKDDARWIIEITDAAERCVLRTPVEGELADAQSKAERLVGYSATTAWEEVA